MHRDGMAFLKSILHHTQNGQNFNSTGVLEVPEVALEELLQNSLVHLDLLHHAAIRLLIFENRIEIINPGCLYGGLSVDDIKLGVSRQRNPLLATFAENTMSYRGLGSGIVRALRENVSIDFINEETANQFRAVIWRTNNKELIEEQKKLLLVQSAIQKGENTIQKDEYSAQSTIQKGENSIQKDSEYIQKHLEELSITLTDLQISILCYFGENPFATRNDYIFSHSGATEGGTIATIGRLQQLKLLKRVGGRKKGHWEIIL